MKLDYIDRTAATLYYMHSHGHQQWELIYNYFGEGTMCIDGKTYTFKPGTVVLLPPEALHEKSSNTGYKDYYVQFTDCPLFPQVYVFEDDCDEKILSLIRVLYSVFYENRTQDVCDVLLEGLIGVLQPYLQNPYTNRYVQMLQNTIIQSFTDPSFLIDQAFSKIPVNKDHLRRKFGSAFGMTPVEYLNSLRVQQATHLLTQGKISISEVAFRCGFYDPCYFSRCFKKYMGLSPRAYKMQKGLSAENGTD